MLYPSCIVHAGVPQLWKRRSTAVFASTCEKEKTPSIGIFLQYAAGHAADKGKGQDSFVQLNDTALYRSSQTGPALNVHL